MHIIAKLANPHIFLIKSDDDKDLIQALYDLNESYVFIFPFALKLLQPKIIIMGNDWGQIGKEIITQAKKAKITTVCIQEGAVNVGNPASNPLQHADYIFTHGKVMEKYLKRDGIILTGNPKYKLPGVIRYPDPPVIMINCNFAYHLGNDQYEDARTKWLSTVVSACEEVGIKFFISQHPKDNTQLDPKWEVIRSNSKNLNSQIESATIIITQRSTMVYDAFCLGRQVIYYNFPEPWQETNPFAIDENNALIIVKEADTLADAIRKALSELESNKNNRAEFLKYHCNLYPNATAAEYVVKQELDNIIQRVKEND